MAKPMVVGNWKMYTSASDAQILATVVRNNVAHVDLIEVVLCPPFVWLTEVSNILGKSAKVKLGAQNMYFENEGAYTGEVSPHMLKGLVEYVILGHSERREYFGETDLEINEKVISALKAGLKPIICVGEKKKSSRYPTAVMNQLKEAIMHIPKNQYKNIVVAYEPVWAIGTGESADPEYAARVISQLRELVGDNTPILYGGSVNSKSAEAFSSRPEIDGLLVGGASLRSGEFINICHVWSKGKNFK